MRGLWQTLLRYLGLRRSRVRTRVDNAERLQQFLVTRASFVAQTSLYSYLRTRAGVRFGELFNDEVFVKSLNEAKWHVWLACLSDLSVYAGGLLAHRAPAPGTVGTLMQAVVERALAETGVPAEADAEFPAHAQRVRARIALSDWHAVRDDDSSFTESPESVVRWAPIVEMLMELDAPIVRNSVRFRWQEIRRELRRDLDADAVLASTATEPD